MSSILLATFLTLLSPSAAMPLTKRASTGAKAGMGIGIAVAAIIAALILLFLIIHFRRARHIAALNKERAILAGEKNPDGSDKIDKYDPRNAPNAKSSEKGAPRAGNTTTTPRRNKSVKDRLMGPLYRGSTIDLIPLPPKARFAGTSNRQSTMSTVSANEGAHWDTVEGQPIMHKPWAAGESSPRPSFSSKRATRMMMMM